MSTQAHVVRLSADEYLRAEGQGEIRHEFVRGQVFDMVGRSDTHNLISLNIASALKEQLRDRSCRVFMADMKVRVQAADVFYYPDVFVTGDPNDAESYFKEHPCVIFEVLSASTEGTDRREKFLSYELLESLREYVLVHQDLQAVEVFHRDAPGGSWAKFILSSDDEITFLSLNVRLTLAQIYEGIDLARGE